MGYKQELKRDFRPVEVFGLVFSTMGLVPSIASTVSFALPAGPAGMVWSWFLASGCICLVALALADLASAFPTAGGLCVNTTPPPPPLPLSPLGRKLFSFSCSKAVCGGFELSF